MPGGRVHGVLMEVIYRHLCTITVSKDHMQAIGQPLNFMRLPHTHTHTHTCTHKHTHTHTHNTQTHTHTHKHSDIRTHVHVQ